MPSINVVVTATAPDIQADTLARAAADRADMTLIGGRVLSVDETDVLLGSGSLTGRCGIVLVGPDEDTSPHAERLFAESNDYVVMRVAAPFGDTVHVAAHHAGLQEVLTALRILVDHAGVVYPTHVTRFEAGAGVLADGGGRALVTNGRGRLLHAALRWIHETLRRAAAGLVERSGDLPGLTLAGTTLVELLDRATQASGVAPDSLINADRALVEACDSDEDSEPLALIFKRLALNAVEFRLFLLALAPELNPLYQRCVGVLLDDLGRRVGTLGLCSGLLGEPAAVRLAIGATGSLARWRLLEAPGGLWPAADEPLRVDAALVSWILGDRDALLRDARVARSIRDSSWVGSALIGIDSERLRGDTFVDMLQGDWDGQWLVFAGEDLPGWRAVLELGAVVRESPLIRVEAAQVVALAAPEIEDLGSRLGRAARLTKSPLVVDVAQADQGPETERTLGILFAAVGATRCRAAVLCADTARVARLLGTMPFQSVEGPALSDAARLHAFMSAARLSGAHLDREQARDLMLKHPLQIDGFARAMAAARSARTYGASAAANLDRFVAACKEVAAEGLSHFAQRIEPTFSLDEVVLPPDRKQQLLEIVSNVQLADRVLVDWKFGERLPYGRGVTALFHGPSGTGKTMAALAVARQLGVQVLRIDLSRIVSKYIGETEKNVDRVFEDARKSGAALLFDEAEALLGKRSEVKDAHDRYANIEVAYLLQRMESYEGLAILTTNLWQNVDPAFLRRLRFIIDFPRPDAAARDTIWRQCLPDGSHSIDGESFRLLARKVDLTGGHIRQITLRAAFVAAAAEKTIELDHIVYAANAELAKTGLQPVNLDVPHRRRVA